MPRKRITREKAKAILWDIFHCRHDVLTLAEAHGVDVELLARWVHQPSVQRVLSGLCMLADFQTQILLSRYRSVAAGKLLRLANGEAEAAGKGGSDVARRACVDLLRLDLKRTQTPESGEKWRGLEELEEEEARGLVSLRQLLFGEESRRESKKEDSGAQQEPKLGGSESKEAQG